MGACCSSEEKKHKKHKKSKKVKNNRCCAPCCYGNEACGCCCGSSNTEKDEAMAVNLGKILSLDTMGFDKDGNLRHGFNRRDRLGEMQQIIYAESQTKKEATKWAIVDATWLYQWLAYVNSEDNSVPEPGPCHNFRLVYEDNCMYYPRIGLVMEKNGKMGDYRKISLKSWEAFKKLYPGSYPDITATFDYFDVAKGEIDPHGEDGYYPTTSWVIANMKKKRKSNLSLFERFGIGRRPSYSEAEPVKLLDEEDMDDNEVDEDEKENKTEKSVVEAPNANPATEAKAEGDGKGKEKEKEEATTPPAAPEKEEEEKQQLLRDGEGSTAGGSGSEGDDKEKKPTKAEDKAPALLDRVPSRPVVERRDDKFYDDIFNRNSEIEEENL